MLNESEEENLNFKLEQQALNQLAQTCSQISREHGFHDVIYDQWEANVMVKLALIHSEVSEATEVFRKRAFKENLTPAETKDFVEELADIVIRVNDLCGQNHWDIGTAILNKIEKNRFRPFLHGKNF